MKINTKKAAIRARKKVRRKFFSQEFGKRFVTRCIENKPRKKQLYPKYEKKIFQNDR